VARPRRRLPPRHQTCDHAGLIGSPPDTQGRAIHRGPAPVLPAARGRGVEISVRDRVNASLGRLRRPGWRPCGPSHFEGGGIRSASPQDKLLP